MTAFSHQLVSGARQDGGTSPQTLTAIPGQAYALLGLSVSGPAVADDITITYTKNGAAESWVFRWDFANGGLIASFPAVILCDTNTSVTITITGGATQTRLFFAIN